MAEPSPSEGQRAADVPEARLRYATKLAYGFGRRHPFMYASALPLALAFVGLFSPPAALQDFGLFVWLLVFAVLTRGAMTLYHVPHIALGAELSSHFHERTTVVAYRQFFSTFGQLLVFGTGFGVFFSATPEYPHGQFNVAAYGPFALC